MAQLIKHQWQKVLLIALGVVMALLVLGFLLINTILTPILSKKLKSAVLKGSDSLYHIDFSKAELHLLSGKAVLYNIVLTPDSQVFKQMKQRGKNPGNVFRLQVKRLLISDAHPFKLYFNKELKIGFITLNDPEVQVSKYASKADTTKKDERTLYQKLSKSLKLINVGTISLNDIKLTYKDFTGKKSAISKLNHMSLKATDLLIDSATQTDTSRTLYCKDITSQLNNFSGTTKTGLYIYKVKSIRLSTQTSQLTIAGIDMQPLSSKTFFAKSKEDRFMLHLDTVKFHGFDYQTFGKKQDIDVKKVVVNKGSFEVYSNPNPPMQTADRLVTFPHWLIRQVKTGINADTVQVKHIIVTYKEYNKKMAKTGAVWFTNTIGTFYNITNKQDRLKNNNIGTAKLSTNFMAKGKLNLLFSFNLNDAAYSYSYRGHLGPMNMEEANPAVMPLGSVRIDSGKLKGLDFDIHSTQKTSKGNVKFLYNDLKISMLGQGADQTYRKKTLLSLFANGLVVKNNNPDKAGTAPRVANVVFLRPANYPFFQTVWLTLLSGIKKCAMGKAEPKEVKKPLTEKEKKKQEKEFKKARKAKEKEEKKHQEKLEEAAKNKKKSN